ncbi:DUF6783 domain-containing protein [Blautia sp. Sow4_E7]|uniref:DUF6783 domain-containing protein n=1 Tax=Blautia sp. Sow4_E7 TaxID=3438749 RepID=UPI003F8DB146
MLLNSARACPTKTLFCKMCFSICGRFYLDEGGATCCGNRIQVKKYRKVGHTDCGNNFAGRLYG